ncbi:signal peptidase I [Tamilnaduibacter salinus]|uniref:Signal peptidase I n=1 Tax=Tamilnaduibacter salinus TaxID=1484056 RepID=A0A2A2HZ81_9GAMM|nr:signal peptidase I [Tamilnaduibacter salinus]PAV24647.1 signal peptidase I [Tamilnaduibacter salinus]
MPNACVRQRIDCIALAMVIVLSVALTMSRQITTFTGLILQAALLAAFASLLAGWIGRTWGYRAIGTVALFVVFCVVIYCLRKPLFGVGVYHVVSASMEPTVPKGSIVLVDEWWPKPEAKLPRCSIIAFRGNGLVQIKRVIAVPGDHIAGQNGRVLVNGEASDCYPQSLITMYRNVATRQLTEGHFFVVGDNHAHSRDSRTYGTIQRHQVAGRVRDIF